MSTFYVPIENRQAPEATRWFFVVAEAIGPVDAMLEAREAFPKLVVWAAVRTLPDVEYMRDLRRCLDNSKRIKRNPAPLADQFVSA